MSSASVIDKSLQPTKIHTKAIFDKKFINYDKILVMAAILYFLFLNNLNATEISTHSYEQNISTYSELENNISSNSQHIELNSICHDKEDFKDALLKLRIAIQAYFYKNNRPPKDINELFPYYLKCKPEIKIKEGYRFSVKYIRTTAYDKNYKDAIDDSSEYIYFSDPQSIYFGLILINSKEKSEEEIPYYLY